MANIKDNLEFNIQSIFDGAGFKQFLSSLKSISGVAKSMGTDLGLSASGLEKAISSMSVGDEVIKTLPMVDKEVKKTMDSLEKTFLNSGRVSANEFWSPFSSDKTLNELKAQFPEFTDDISGVAKQKDFSTMFPDKTQFSQILPTTTLFLNELEKMQRIGKISSSEMNLFGKAIGMTSDFLKQGELSAQDFFLQQTTGSKNFTKATGNMKREIATFFEKYNFGFLSLMFIGQQFSRSLQSIIGTSISEFQKFNQNTSEASSIMTGLGANITLLKYTVGEALSTALMPFVISIIEIIQNMADWIEQHPKLTAVIVFGTLALAMFAVTLGTVYSLLNGTASVITTFTPLIKSMGAAAISAAGGLAPLIAIVLGIIAALILMKAAWETNFGGIRDLITEVFNGIKTTLSSVFGDIFAGLKDLFSAISAFMEGDTDKFLSALDSMGKNFAAAQIKLVVGFLALTVKLFLGAVDMLVSTLTSIATIVYGIIEKIGTAIISFIIDKVAKPMLDIINGILVKLGKEKININFDVVANIPSNINEKIQKDLGSIKDFKLSNIIDLSKLGDTNKQIDILLGKIPQQTKAITDTTTAISAQTQANDAANISFLTTATTLNDSLLPSTDSLNKMFTEGLIPSVDQTTLSLDGKLGLNQAMINAADITETEVIPSINDTIAANKRLEASYKSLTKTINDYKKAQSTSKSSPLSSILEEKARRA